MIRREFINRYMSSQYDNFDLIPYTLFDTLEFPPGLLWDYSKSAFGHTGCDSSYTKTNMELPFSLPAPMEMFVDRVSTYCTNYSILGNNVAYQLHIGPKCYLHDCIRPETNIPPISQDDIGVVIRCMEQFKVEVIPCKDILIPQKGLALTVRLHGILRRARQ